MESITFPPWFSIKDKYVNPRKDRRIYDAKELKPDRQKLVQDIDVKHWKHSFVCNHSHRFETLSMDAEHRTDHDVPRIPRINIFRKIIFDVTPFRYCNNSAFYFYRWTRNDVNRRTGIDVRTLSSIIDLDYYMNMRCLFLSYNLLFYCRLATFAHNYVHAPKILDQHRIWRIKFRVHIDWVEAFQGVPSREKRYIDCFPIDFRLLTKIYPSM